MHFLDYFIPSIVIIIIWVEAVKINWINKSMALNIQLYLLLGSDRNYK